MTPAQQEKLLGLALQHRVALEGYSNSVLRRILKIVTEAERQIEKDIIARLGTGAIDDADWYSSRLLRLKENLQAIIRDASAIIFKRLGGDLEAQAKHEAQWHVKATRTAISARHGFDMLTPDRLRAIVYSQPFAGRVLKEHVAGLEAATSKRILRALRMGLVMGDSVPVLLRRITGMGGAFYRDSATPVMKRTLTMILRTAVTHVNTSTQQAMIERNRKLYRGVLWISVLDDRTSQICMGLSGQVFPIDSGPRPPAHPNCRSAILPLLHGVRDPRIKTYEEWLKEQDAETQLEILGPSRYALWTAGGLSLRDFINNTEALTLAQLRRRDVRAFMRAGLRPE